MTKRIYKVKVLSFKNEDIVAGLAHEPPSGVEFVHAATLKYRSLTVAP